MIRQSRWRYTHTDSVYSYRRKGRFTLAPIGDSRLGLSRTSPSRHCSSSDPRHFKLSFLRQRALPRRSVNLSNQSRLTALAQPPGPSNVPVLRCNLTPQPTPGPPRPAISQTSILSGGFMGHDIHPPIALDRVHSCMRAGHLCSYRHQPK